MLHIIVDNKYGAVLAYSAVFIVFVGLFTQVFVYTVIFQDDVYEFATYTLYNLEISQYLNMLLLIVNILSIYSLTVGIATMYYLFSARAFTTYKMVYLMLLNGLLTLGFGGSMIFVIRRADNFLEEAASISEEKIDADVQTAKLTDYSVALYTSCCLERDLLDDNSLFVEQCPDEIDPFEIERGASCFQDQVLYESFLKLGTDDTCDLLNSAVVNFKNVDIPNTKIPYTSLTNGKNNIRLVGSSSEPVFGCGTGLPAAFQYGLYIWLYQKLYPVGVCATIAGVLQILTVAAGAVFLAPSEGSEYVRRLSKHSSKDRIVEKKVVKEKEDEHNFTSLIEDFETEYSY